MATNIYHVGINLDGTVAWTYKMNSLNAEDPWRSSPATSFDASCTQFVVAAKSRAEAEEKALVSLQVGKTAS